MERQAEQGNEWTYEDALELFGISAETAKDSAEVFEKRANIWAYLESRETMLYEEASQSLDPIQTALRSDFTAVVASVRLDDDSKQVHITALEAELEELRRQSADELDEVKERLSKIYPRLGSATDRYLNMSAFGTDEEIATAETEKNKLRHEHDELDDRRITLQGPIDTTERKLEMLASHHAVYKFTELLEAFVRHLESMQQSGLQYELWRNAIVTFVTAVQDMAAHDQLEDTTPVQELLVSDGQLSNFYYSLSTRSAAKASVESKLAIIHDTLRTENLDQKPLIPSR